MLDHSETPAPRFTRDGLHVPPQAAPVDRAVSCAALETDHGAEADLFGLPVGDWLEAPGKYAWEHAKSWLNQ